MDLGEKVVDNLYDKFRTELKVREDLVKRVPDKPNALNLYGFIFNFDFSDGKLDVSVDAPQGDKKEFANYIIDFNNFNYVNKNHPKMKERLHRYRRYLSSRKFEVNEERNVHARASAPLRKGVDYSDKLTQAVLNSIVEPSLMFLRRK